MNIKKTFLLLPAVGAFVVAGFVFNAAHAATLSVQMGPGPVRIGGQQNGPMMGNGSSSRMGGQFPGVFGTVTAINGTTLSVQNQRATSTVYSVDASNATVRKDNATSTVSSIAVGDTVMVRGTVNGTSVTATDIFDGKMMMTGRGGFPGGHFNSSSTRSGTPWNASGTHPYASGTRPFFNSANNVSGTVAAITSTSLTLNGSNGITYDVNITNATLVKQGSSTSSISAIAVGDSVQIQGNVSGTAITANAVLDNVTKVSASSKGGFFGSIGSFIANLFHFKF